VAKHIRAHASTIQQLEGLESDCLKAIQELRTRKDMLRREILALMTPNIIFDEPADVADQRALRHTKIDERMAIAGAEGAYLSALGHIREARRELKAFTVTWHGTKASKEG
jgi:hypothetical protein